MRVYHLVCRTDDVRWTCEFHAADDAAAIEAARNHLRWAGCLFKTGRVVCPLPERRHLAIVSMSDEVRVDLPQRSEE